MTDSGIGTLAHPFCVPFMAADLHQASTIYEERPLRNLVAYGSTNKYRPVNSCKANGGSKTGPLEGSPVANRQNPHDLVVMRSVRSEIAADEACREGVR